MSARLALVAAAAARGHDLDEPLLGSALAERGVAVAVVDWDDADIDWSGFDRVILRSTWDYVERLDEFLAWARAVAATTELSNGIETIEFSIDKHYLQVFEAAGIPVTPTVFVEIGEEAVLPATTDGFIVKPAIGAGGRAVRRFAPAEASEALRHVATVHERGVAAMIQPFLPLVLGLDGAPCVLEAELVEPSLFLPEHPAAVATVADAFIRGLQRR